MKNILIIAGSVRKTRATDKILEQVVAAVETSGNTAQLADLREINLPMFDSPIPPNDPNYSPEYPVVKSLMHDIEAADAALLLVPEYNGMISAALKNAYDWAGKSWHKTPVFAIGYNWNAERHGGLENVRFLMDRVKATMPAEDVHLVFGRDIEVGGGAIDVVVVQEKLRKLLNNDDRDGVPDSASERMV